MTAYKDGAKIIPTPREVSCETCHYARRFGKELAKKFPKLDFPYHVGELVSCGCSASDHYCHIFIGWHLACECFAYGYGK